MRWGPSGSTGCRSLKSTPPSPRTATPSSTPRTGPKLGRTGGRRKGKEIRVVRGESKKKKHENKFAPAEGNR